LSKRRVRRSSLHLPKLTGSKASKKAYNAAYWKKVASHRRKKK
jgi:hypothetical protein